MIRLHPPDATELDKEAGWLVLAHWEVPDVLGQVCPLFLDLYCLKPAHSNVAEHV